MFHPDTLLIIGAGAGVDLNMPTGKGLTPIIADKLDIKFRKFNELFSGNPEIWAALNRAAQGGDSSPYQDASRSISAGMPLANSIDSYLDNHKDNAIVQVCGKLNRYILITFCTVFGSTNPKIA